ncbi:MAG: hypothetical protein JWQ14_2177 [Adhaeribacter sp.]|nr:hypothetical protein [Adhaeribacter sp.]
MEVFRKIYDATEDQIVLNTALTLIEYEDDEKYRKKYLGVWKDVLETART